MMIETRKLGQGEVRVGAIALGAMAFAGWYDTRDDEAGVLAIHRALDAGITLIDTAEAYGNGKSEGLVGRAVRDRRNRAVVATKASKGSPAYLREAVDRSLKHLGLDHIDLYYLHRVDPQVPIEDTVGAMVRLIEQGKIRAIGLSEAGPQSIRRANAVHSITAVQSEYSLWTRDYEADTIPVVRELGIGFVSYYALGRGFFAGTMREVADLGANDPRRKVPRFYAENFDHNVRLVNQLQKIADARNCTLAQLSLAWILHQGESFVPIPGTHRISHLEENIRAAEIDLTKEQLAEMDRLFPRTGAAAGARHDKDRSHELNI